MCLYDLHRGTVAWPTADAGYAAAAAATGGEFEVGAVGAGIGATTNKWRGPDFMVPGGLASATERDGDLVVSALLAVNAHGQIDDGEAHPWPAEAPGDRAFEELTNTTIGVVVTNARLDKLACHWVAQGGHDGFARALVPSHGRSDGDALVAAATGEVDATVDHVRFLACRVVERAIRSLA
jgi:L-aminopeptidase/D-esterase-like protein